MQKLTRRSLFGVGAAVLPTVALPADARLDEQIVPPAVEPEIIEAVSRFVLETLPRCRGHFVSGVKGTANWFDYSGSGQGFYVTCLDRISQVITECCRDEEVPTFAVTDKATWSMTLEVVNEMLTEAHVATGICARMYRDLRSKWLYWDGLPIFWDQTLTDGPFGECELIRKQLRALPPIDFSSRDWQELDPHKEERERLRNILHGTHPQPHCIYVVNHRSLGGRPDNVRRLNGVILNTDRS